MSNYIEQFWRDATPADAIKEPPMVARFRADDDTRFSSPITLCGARRRFSEGWFWYASDGGLWTVCQVYDPPAGFEIGEGWRLIDVEGNTPQENDQFYDLAFNAWCFCNAYLRHGSYDKNAIVRRRIEPPKPKYVPFGWEDREQLRGRWIYRSEDGDTLEEIANKLDSRTFVAVAKRLLENNWRFLDTNEPVGKKVTQ